MLSRSSPLFSRLFSSPVSSPHHRLHVMSSWLSSISSKGSFERKESQFRQWIKTDGSTPFKPASGRYHLYVSLACPWAHRTLIVRALKGLEDAISYTVVDWFLDQQAGTGWTFTDTIQRCTKDPLHPEFIRLRQVYELTDPEYKGNITVPVLFDRETNRIVNNESSEIIRMFNFEFNEFAKNTQVNLVPESLRSSIDDINAWIYPTINNGVYRCGFATTQQAYDDAVKILFEHLEKVEEILSKQRYLVGNQITEADVRLFTTLIRFDAVYYHHFKCNYKRISEFPNLHAYMCELYQIPAIQKDVDFTHIRHHYESSHRTINPHGIVSRGPAILEHLNDPHGRDTKFPSKL